MNFTLLEKHMSQKCGTCNSLHYKYIKHPSIHVNLYFLRYNVERLFLNNTYALAKVTN